MASSTINQAKAQVWLIPPNGFVQVDDSVKGLWEKKVKTGLVALFAGASRPMFIGLVILCDIEALSDKEALKEAVKKSIRSIEISIEKEAKDAPSESLREAVKKGICSISDQAEFSIKDIANATSCLQRLGEISPNYFECDLLNTARCAQVHRLLLIDDAGNAFPCYGYWDAYKRGERGFSFPDQKTILEAYERGRFRSLCAECDHAHTNKNLDVFPCSRLGSHVKDWVWNSDHRYCHIQFAGEEKEKWCKLYKPLFEPSLERSRSLLEKILTSGDPPFWRTALIEEKRELSDFWPDRASCDGKDITLLPIFGDYQFGWDTPSALYDFPTTSALPDDVDQIEPIKSLFLPACFIPPLRALFREHESVHLVSIILTDRHRDSEFNYRSLYRESSPCFRPRNGSTQSTSWMDVWRLPRNVSSSASHHRVITPENHVGDSGWGIFSSEGGTLKWRDVTLNLSSSVLDEKTKHPIEYVALFNSNYSNTDVRLGNKLVIDFSSLIEHINGRFPNSHSLNECFFVSQSIALKNRAIVDSVGMVIPGKSPEIDAILRSIWEFCFGSTDGGWCQTCRDAFVSLHYKGINDNDLVPCSAAKSAEDQLLIGTLIANYIIWVFAVFGKEHIAAVESFNATAFSDKEPSQFVVFSSSVLDATARARFKLTLATLLQPIENAYAIYAEAQTERKAALHAAFQNSGHTLLARIGSVRKYFNPPYVPEWHRELLKSLRSTNPEDISYQELDDVKRAYHLAWNNVESLFELCLVLQLWGFSKPEDFWYGWKDPKKKERFFEYTNESYDLQTMIQSLCSEVFDYRNLHVGECDGVCFSKYHDVYLRLINDNVERCLIHPKIMDPQRNEYCRLGDGVLKAIFLEVLNNSVKYGEPIQPDNKDSWAFIKMWSRVEEVYGKPRLVLWNYSGKEMGDTQGWRAILPNAGKGLGLASGVLRNLSLGEIHERRFRVKTGKQIYAIAITFSGLEVARK